jgi:hypothetical protein
VVEYKTEQRKRTVPVTTYKTVAEEVVETVPFTTCVRVPVAPVMPAPAPCGPVMPPPCY